MMKFEEIMKEIESIDNYDFGFEIWDAISEEDNFVTDIGKYVLLVIGDCRNEDDFEFADRMFTAITGWSIETIINRTKGLE